MCVLKMETIREKLDEIFEFANKNNLSGVIIRAGELHKLVNPLYKYEKRFRMCCVIMREYMKPGDEILYEPPSGESSAVEIFYKPPFGK